MCVRPNRHGRPELGFKICYCESSIRRFFLTVMSTLKLAETRSLDYVEVRAYAFVSWFPKDLPQSLRWILHEILHFNHTNQKKAFHYIPDFLTAYWARQDTVEFQYSCQR